MGTGLIRKRRRLDIPAREVADLYRCGFSLYDIACLYEADEGTVRLRLREAGIKPRPPGARSRVKDSGGQLELQGAKD